VDEVLERLETRIAFLESANQELSEVLYRQQREIEGLRLRLASLAERLRAASSGEEQRTLEDERPPHY